MTQRSQPAKRAYWAGERAADALRRALRRPAGRGHVHVLATPCHLWRVCMTVHQTDAYFSTGSPHRELYDGCRYITVLSFYITDVTVTSRTNPHFHD